MSTASLHTVADGVLRISRAHVNCYLIADGGLTLIDAGLPGMWPQLLEALRIFGARPGDLDAIVLTHGHFDHVGLCRRVTAAVPARVLVHERDRALVRHPYRYAHESSPLAYPFRFPRALGVLGSMAAAGAFWIGGVEATGTVEPGRPLDVPGRPRPVFSPGHTDGHCGFLLEQRGVLFSGDALVTLDPYTGLRGPRVVARAATADSATALHSLDALAQTAAGVVLPGHGEPFPGPVAEAATLARDAGVA